MTGAVVGVLAALSIFRLEFPGSAWAFRAGFLIAPLLAGAALLAAVRGKRPLRGWRALVTLAGIGAFAFAVTWFKTPVEWRSRGLADALLLIAGLGVAWSIAFSLRAREARPLALAFVATVAVISAASALWFFLGPVPDYLDCTFRDDFRTCLRPPLLGTGTAGFLLLAWLVGIPVLANEKSRRGRALGAAILGALLLGLTLSFARAPQLALEAGVGAAAVLAWRSRARLSVAARRWIAFWLVLGVAFGRIVALGAERALRVASEHGLKLATDRTFGGMAWGKLAPAEGADSGTWRDRIQLWERLARDIPDSPIWGHGFSAYRRHLENNRYSRMLNSETFAFELVHAGGALLVAGLLLWLLTLARASRRHDAAAGAAGNPVHALNFLVPAALAATILGQANPFCWNPVYWVFAALALRFGWTGLGAPRSPPAPERGQRGA